MTEYTTEEPGAAPPNSGLARWETFTAVPMLLLSLAWIVCITLYVLNEPNSEGRIPSGVALVSIWVVFIIDYVTRLALAKHRKLFFKESWLDLCSVVIPIMRPFHLLTYLRGISYFRKPTRGALRARLAVWGFSFAVIFIYTIALSVFEVERNAPGRTIDSLGNAVWWAMVTITTVGYGDYTPVTIPGRVLAVALMIGGIAIVGTTSAIVISVLNDRMQKVSQRHPANAKPAEAALAHLGAPSIED